MISLNGPTELEATGADRTDNRTGRTFARCCLSIANFHHVQTPERFGARAPQPVQSFGWQKLEIIWTVIPILCLVVLTGCVAWTMHVSDPSDNNEFADLRIVGQQWWEVDVKL
jgi:hypothetical protein